MSGADMHNYSTAVDSYNSGANVVHGLLGVRVNQVEMAKVFFAASQASSMLFIGEQLSRIAKAMEGGAR